MRYFTMKWAAICTVIAFLFSCSNSGSSSDETSKPGPTAKSSHADSVSGIRENADYVLDQLVALESVRDVTCWTSFRQLDWFIAEKSYGEFATLAKVAAVKALVRSLWEKASNASIEGKISAEAIRSAATLPIITVPQSGAAEFEKFTNDIGMKNYSDYQKTAEHWRVVLAVLEDELAETGGIGGLRSMEKQAVEALAESATTLSLLLLKESNVAAEHSKNVQISGDDIKTAYTKISHEVGLLSAARKRKPVKESVLREQLAPLTKRLIDGKFEALQTFNNGAKDLVSDINRVAPMPLSADAIMLLKRDLQSFVHFVVSGRQPMRADNYLSDGAYVASKTNVKPGFLSETAVQNVVMQLFPHRILPNGDIVVRFEPNPGPMSGKVLEAFDIRILDHEMNGVRDSAIHWMVAQQVWKERPFAMDPFASEYLTEVVSMMMATWMHRSEMIAKAMGKNEIDAKVAKRVRTMAYVMVMPPDPQAAGWSPEREADKARVLAATKQPLFVDASAKKGLPTEMKEFGADGKRVASSGRPAPTSFDLQTIMGGGIAVGDVNDDGYVDFYVSGEALGHLYLNGGKKNPGSFSNSTSDWGLPEILDGHGTLFFDLEGDGDLDLLVLRSKHPSSLFVQQEGRFSDAAKTLGFMTHYGAQVAHVFDYDRDGDLDIYVGYYGSKEAHDKFGQIQSKPALDGLNGSPNELWRNDGAKLVRAGASIGLGDLGWALAVSSFDYDGDGYLDLYVANDFGANAMYRNLGNGKFESVGDKLHTADRGSGMNVAMSDVNGDGNWDFYVTNIDMFSKNIKVIFPRDESTIDISESLTQAFQYLSGNQLYMSNTEGGFSPEESKRFEPKNRGWGWDAAFFDVENDGDEDLYLTNGWVQGSYAGGQKNQLYLNDTGYFYLAPDNQAEAFSGNSRSAAAIDIDNDGDLDIVATNFRQPPKLLENVQSSGNHWLRIALKGKGKNPHALGAKVEIRAGEHTQLRQVGGGRGYLSQNSSVVSVGLGKAKTAEVKVYWPDGSTSSSKGLKSNSLHTIEQ